MLTICIVCCVVTVFISAIISNVIANAKIEKHFYNYHKKPKIDKNDKHDVSWIGEY